MLKLSPVITTMAVAMITPPTVRVCTHRMVTAATVIAPVACVAAEILLGITSTVYKCGVMRRKSRILVMAITCNAMRWPAATSAVVELTGHVAQPDPALEVRASLMRHHPRIVFQCI